jgi:hypothetical protein
MEEGLPSDRTWRLQNGEPALFLVFFAIGGGFWG